MTNGYFRKKPVVIQAFQASQPMTIHTLEGDMEAATGDWIITGIKGEQYPCKPEIFAETYEPCRADGSPDPARDVRILGP